MLKTLKWVYNLGVSQERTRIAAHLDHEAARRRETAIAGYNMLLITDNRGNKMTEKRKERLAFDSRVHDEVKFIIQSIMEPKETYATSLLFPESETK